MSEESRSSYKGSLIVTRAVEEAQSARGHRRFKASYSIESEDRGFSVGQFFNDFIFDSMENAAANALSMARLEVDGRLQVHVSVEAPIPRPWRIRAG